MLSDVLEAYVGVVTLHPSRILLNRCVTSTNVVVKKGTPLGQSIQLHSNAKCVSCFDTLTCSESSRLLFNVRRTLLNCCCVVSRVFIRLKTCPQLKKIQSHAHVA